MIKILQAIAAFFLIPPLTHAAGFDCRKALTLVEQLICKDNKLSALDDQMAASL